MKKFALILTIGITSLAATAQNSSHEIFVVPTDKTPKTVTVLGRDPQFPALRHLRDAGEVYDQLKALAGNAMYSGELNELFTSLGYSGVNDPDFTREDVQSSSLPYGAIGMMGDGNNNYHYSILMLPNQTSIPTWVVDAKNNGTDLYFLTACGNSFNYANPERVSVVERETVVTDYSGKGKMKVRLVARHQNEDCSWCKKCDDVDGEETVLLSEENIDDIPVAQEGSAYPVKTLYLDVDKKTFKKMQEGQVGTSASRVNYNTLNNVARRR
ncbi:MAG: hypothetical protein K0R82_39 [Flavipsychrobacter sp.]|jgi:hypothetical protein|nr:hypothetical protein [Flavipsychrobacter sp.]